MNPVRSVLFFIGILLAPLLLYLLYGAGLRVLGYEFAKGPDVLAERLVNEERPAKDCFLYRTLDLWMRPSTYELQMECVYDYASLTKDPEVCELLMPSSYAMSCIGAASNFPHGDCNLKNDGQLLCVVTPGPNFVQSFYDVDQIDNCETYRKYNNRQVVFWCYAERANQFGDLSQCLSYAVSDEEGDYCYYQRATMLEDLRIDDCDHIRQRHVRLGCQTTIRAWTTYSELMPTRAPPRS